ncbi:MAG: N-acyl-D-amino-acid deacylase, partial [Acidimicrobiaceae bacterium]|nr:N-acyl-D-amino-acid deacylase [Acidimicrobiaceae bacterium]
KVRQGVTLEVLGQDGLSYAPVTDETLPQLQDQLAAWNGNPPGFDWSWRSVGEYLDRLDEGIAVNAAYLIPHGSVRMAVMGVEDRPPSTAELDEMIALVVQGMAEGAFGLSTGLTYAPGMYADDDELVALLKPVAAAGGYYCTHHRNYGSRALAAYAEAIDIARRAGVGLQLSHCLLPFPVNRGRAPELAAMIDGARADGVDVTFDAYPYTAGSTYLHAFLPGWMSAGGTAETVERLRRADLRPRLRVEVEEVGSDGFNGVPVDWSVVVISGTRHERNGRWVGLSVAEAATTAGQSPFDFACDLVADEELGTACVMHVGNEDNNRFLMAHAAAMVGSDGILVGQRPHPRAWGCFPRVLGTYVRELGVLSLEAAVAQMTSRAAARLGLHDRGVVAAGAAADLVCFDPETVADRATYESPRQAPAGIPHVFVNGRAVVADGRLVGDLPGRSVRPGGAPPPTVVYQPVGRDREGWR